MANEEDDKKRSFYDLSEEEEAYMERLIDEVQEGEMSIQTASRTFEHNVRAARARRRYFGDK